MRCDGESSLSLKYYPGFPHGMPTTQAETINADLLEFIRS
jgi:non-heme chloroperoxidase